jgi:hypothetical protein
LIEAKRSFTGITEAEIGKLLELARALRPDFAGFAVHRPKSESTLSKESLLHIGRELSKVDTTFILWAADDNEAANSLFLPTDIPLPYGRTMHWTAWQMVDRP